MPARDSARNGLRCAVLLLCTVLIPQPAARADVTIDLQTATLALDDAGRVTSLTSTGDSALTVPGPPALYLETDQTTRFPTAISRTGNTITVTFDGGATAEFSVTTQRGFVLLDLQKLTSPRNVRRFRLLGLPIRRDTKVASPINAVRINGHTLALMAAEPNVHAFSNRNEAYVSDKSGCSHEFARVDDNVRAGKYAARFTATSERNENDGWSVRGKQFDRPLDLSGCKAIRAWVHGDGNGQSLKIQLNDDAGGYRDNYVKIDFTGWKHLTLTDCPINTLRYDRVRHLNIYYNGLPAEKTVTCLVDGIEAVLERGGRDQVVVLEDFEGRACAFWAAGPRTLAVETSDRHGVEPARFGLIACPEAEFAETVQRFEVAAGLPSPRPGGVWSKQSPWVNRSYLFITRFSEPQTDKVLALARRGGFHTILILGGSWHKTTGHYEVNTRNFPDGLDSLKRTVGRFKDAGFRVGLHFLGASIYPPDPYLVPVPDKRLVKGASAVLAADVDEKVGFIPTARPPEGFPAEDGGYRGKGAVLWIDDELIRYAARSMTPPYGFVECTRGYLGTRPAPHRKETRVDHLVRSYGYHMYDMDTTLLGEVADHFAKVANACDVDMLYFDGSERLQGDHWYYNARLHKAFYDRMKNKDMLLQASSFSHYSWHIMSRSASADGHGDIKGYLDARSPWFDTLADNLMPLDIGWYYGYDPMATPDMFEYVLGATIGYEASMSFQVSVDAAEKNPFTGRILDLIARYEKIRLSGRTPKAMRERLRIDPALGGTMEPRERAARLEKRREYRLVGPEGKEAFQRIVYSSWKEIAAVDGKRNVWQVRITDGPAPVGVQIRVTSGPWPQPEPAYHAKDALTLETFDDLAPYAATKNPGTPVYEIAPGQGGSTLQGVTQRLLSTDEDAREGARCAVYTATSQRKGSDGWSVIGKRFAKPLDISWHKGIGLQMRGDGKGGRFKVQLRDTVKGVQDYYITNDYTGWRYQRLVRPARDGPDYTRVASLTLYYNGLPGRTTVSCGLDDIKALRRLDDRAIDEPSITISGRRFAWTGRLAIAQYLFFEPDGTATRYGPTLGDGERLPPRAQVLTLPAGTYDVAFTCRGPLTAPLRARVLHLPPERHAIP